MTSVEIPLSDDQELLRTTSARFIRSKCPMPRVRDLADSDSAVDPDYVRQAAELGWFALLIPEEHGGGSVSGAGLADAAIVASERGKALQPGPFVVTNVVADALVRSGSEDQRAKVLPDLATGEATASWAIADRSGGWDPGRAVRAEPTGRNFRLRGTASLVPEAGSVDWLLVTAGSPAGLSQFLLPTATPGVRIEKMDSLDLTRGFFRVNFNDVEVPSSAAVGPPSAADEGVERALQVAIVLTVAEMVGAMTEDFETTVEYAKARTAFGRPIGSFQSVKHVLADTSLLLEASKAALAAAVRAVADPDGSERADGAEVASIAKAFVGDSAIDLAQTCWQVYGGIGYTWEHDQHFFMRRLTTDAVLYGEPAWHRERICKIHGLQGATVR